MRLFDDKLFERRKKIRGQVCNLNDVEEGDD